MDFRKRLGIKGKNMYDCGSFLITIRLPPHKAMNIQTRLNKLVAESGLSRNRILVSQLITWLDIIAPDE